MCIFPGTQQSMGLTSNRPDWGHPDHIAIFMVICTFSRNTISMRLMSNRPDWDRPVHMAILMNSLCK